jgi:hypothetical protein
VRPNQAVRAEAIARRPGKGEPQMAQRPRRIRRSHLFILLALSFATFASGRPAPAGLPRLKVSENRRFLVTEEGKPFFYLADTGWELFHRLNHDDAERYLKNRADKGFTVIQAVVLAELDGLHDPNPYGHTPLANDDPARPNEDYFKDVDWTVNKAEELGLFIGMLPTWGDKWNKPPGQGGIFTPENAAAYGEFLGRRYRDKPVIWILGGDRPIATDAHRAILDALAGGLRKGDGGSHLITFHPPGGANSAQWLHDAPWLDFNMWQNGHCAEVPVWDRIGKDYGRTPVKPVMDAEPLYEDHPICFNAKEHGYSVAADCRHFLYWDLFAGAHGHTYGNHSVWQMYAPGRKPVNGPLNFWYDALDHPGAGQMRHARALLESRPFLVRVPDQSVIASNPAAGLKRLQATRASDGRYAMVYSPAGRVFSVDMTKIDGGKVKAWWFDPRTGKAESIGEFPSQGKREFAPPDAGENLDWVLVLDDATKGFGPPGAR